MLAVTLCGKFVLLNEGWVFNPQPLSE